MPRSPIANSGVPQTIHELPDEENKGPGAFHGHKPSDFGFNDRDLSQDGAAQTQYMKDKETIEADREKVERKVQATTQSGFIDRKATVTGSSFYDQTMVA